MPLASNKPDTSMPYTSILKKHFWAGQAVSAGAGAGLLQKLGRVLREKAATDLERITKGTSRTREKLGV